MYEASQRQRELETLVRYAKDGQIIAKEADDLKSIEKYQNRVKSYTQEYMTFSKKAGLKARISNLYVKDYKKIKL